MKRLIITEQEKFDILQMYNLLSEDLKRPIQKLMECKFTTDGKYVIYEGKAYSTQTGEEIPINEQWTLSDVLHTGADILSAGMDFVIPGSGAVVDTINAISYVIEAQFKNAEEKDSLYLMAAITFGFVILPGPLQAIAIPLKRAITTGKNFASPIVKQGLKIIGGAIDTLLLNIPTKINQALKSSLAKGILGRWGKKITGFIDNFTSRIKQLLGSLTGKAGKAGKEVTGDVFHKNHTLGDVGIPDEWWHLPTDKMKSLIIKQDELSSRSINSLINKTSNLAKKPFNPNNVKILNKSNIGGREIMEVQLENGQNVIFYKVTGMGEKSLPPPGAWSVIPGFLDNAYVQGKKVKRWFLKTHDTIGLTHKSLDGQGTNKYLTDMAQFLEKNGVEGLLKSSGEQAIKLTTKSTLTTVTKTSLTNFFRVMPKISKGSMVLRKLGFVKGKTYRYIGDDVAQKGSKVIIDSIDDSGVMLTQILKSGEKLKYKKPIPIETFVKNAIGAPWMRRGYSVVVPLFIKRFSDVITPNGDIDYSKLENLPDLDPNTTSEESLQYLQEEVAEYEGDTLKYTSNQNVINFQTALKLLGYKLGNFGPNKDGVDGKFGPITQTALKDFQSKNKLDSSLGKMDRATAKKLSEVLKTNKTKGSEQVQTNLNSI